MLTCDIPMVMHHHDAGHREEGDLGPVYGFQWRHFGAKYVMSDTIDDSSTSFVLFVFTRGTLIVIPSTPLRMGVSAPHQCYLA